LSYINQMRAILPEADATELMKIAVRMPDALKTERQEIDEAEWAEIEPVFNKALENIIEFRKQEGEKLRQDFEECIENIRALMDEVVSYDEERLLTVKENLRNGLEQLQLTIEHKRFEHELIYYIEKLEINE